jgi:DNA-directed RNA polymerase subunit RPC12/RpoP
MVYECEVCKRQSDGGYRCPYCNSVFMRKIKKDNTRQITLGDVE